MSPTYILLRNCLIMRGQKQIQARLGRWVLVRDTWKSRGVLFRMYSWGERWFHLSFASALFHSLSGCSFWFETVIDHLSYTPSVRRPRSFARPLVSSTFPIALPFMWFGPPESQFSSHLCANFTTTDLTRYILCMYARGAGGREGREERKTSFWRPNLLGGWEPWIGCFKITPDWIFCGGEWPWGSRSCSPPSAEFGLSK